MLADCANCVYKYYCKTKKSNPSRCSICVVGRKTELLKILTTATHYRWHSVMDENTCTSCMCLSGKIISRGELASLMPPIHSKNVDGESDCRCVIEPLGW